MTYSEMVLERCKNELNDFTRELEEKSIEEIILSCREYSMKCDIYNEIEFMYYEGMGEEFSKKLLKFKNILDAIYIESLNEDYSPIMEFIRGSIDSAVEN